MHEGAVCRFLLQDARDEVYSSCLVHVVIPWKLSKIPWHGASKLLSVPALRRRSPQ